MECCCSGSTLDHLDQNLPFNKTFQRFLSSLKVEHWPRSQRRARTWTSHKDYQEGSSKKSRKGSLEGVLEPKRKKAVSSKVVGGEGRGKSEVTCVLCVTLGLELELGEEQVGSKPVMEYHVRVCRVMALGSEEV